VKDYISPFAVERLSADTYYHTNGPQKGFVSYVDGTQRGRDERGNKIKGLVVEDFPKFGVEWRNYIAQNLRANIAAEAGLPEGFYKLMVKFIIDQEGKITDVAAVEVPAGCSACATEAARVISLGPLLNLLH
jgi:hypothetical protein